MARVTETWIWGEIMEKSAVKASELKFQQFRVPTMQQPTERECETPVKRTWGVFLQLLIEDR